MTGTEGGGGEENSSTILVVWQLSIPVSIPAILALTLKYSLLSGQMTIINTKP